MGAALAARKSYHTPVWYISQELSRSAAAGSYGESSGSSRRRPRALAVCRARLSAIEGENQQEEPDRYDRQAEQLSHVQGQCRLECLLRLLHKLNHESRAEDQREKDAGQGTASVAK